LKSIEEIIRDRIKIIKAIHVAQKEIQESSMDVAVILSMVQIALLDADEHDLAKWMTFYMMKKLEKEAGPEKMEKFREQLSRMSPDEVRLYTKKAMDMIAEQREELLTKIKKEKE